MYDVCITIRVSDAAEIWVLKHGANNITLLADVRPIVGQISSHCRAAAIYSRQPMDRLTDCLNVVLADTVLGSGFTQSTLLSARRLPCIVFRDPCVDCPPSERRLLCSIRRASREKSVSHGA